MFYGLVLVGFVAAIATAVALVVKVEFKVGAAVGTFDFAFAKHVLVKTNGLVASGAFNLIEIVVAAAAVTFVIVVIVVIEVFLNGAEVLVDFLDVIAGLCELVLKVGNGQSDIVNNVDKS